MSDAFDSWTSLIWKLLFWLPGIYKSLQELFFDRRKHLHNVYNMLKIHPPPPSWLCLERGVVLCVRREIRSYMQGSIPAVPVIWGSASLKCRL